MIYKYNNNIISYHYNCLLLYILITILLPYYRLKKKKDKKGDLPIKIYTKYYIIDIIIKEREEEKILI